MNSSFRKVPKRDLRSARPHSLLFTIETAFLLSILIFRGLWGGGRGGQRERESGVDGPREENDVGDREVE